MTPRGLTILAALTAVAVVGAAVSANTAASVALDARRGETFLPELIAAANRIDAVRIDAADWKLVLEKQGERFVDASGYPARTEMVRDLVASLGTLRIEERKTARPERYSELEVDDPGKPDSGGRRIELLAAGKPVVTIVLGKRDYTVGGTQGGQFARRAGDPTSWLLRGAAQVPESRAGWFDARLVSVKPEALAGATLIGADGEPARLAPGAGRAPLALANPPADREPEDARIGQIARVLGALEFADVRKAKGGDIGSRLVVETATGLQVTLSALADGASETARWIRVEPRALRPEAKQAADALAARVDGFEFRVEGQAAEALGWHAADLLKAAAKPG